MCIRDRLYINHITIVSTVLAIVKGGFLFSRLRFVLSADHGILAHGLQQCLIFLYELALPQGNACLLYTSYDSDVLPYEKL